MKVTGVLILVSAYWASKPPKNDAHFAQKTRLNLLYRDRLRQESVTAYIRDTYVLY